MDIQYDTYRLPLKNRFLHKNDIFKACQALMETRMGRRIFPGEKPLILLCGKTSVITLKIENPFSAFEALAIRIPLSDRSYAILLRRSVWECLGGFQKGEDFDGLCARIRATWGERAVS